MREVLGVRLRLAFRISQTTFLLGYQKHSRAKEGQGRKEGRKDGSRVKEGQKRKDGKKEGKKGGTLRKEGHERKVKEGRVEGQERKGER